MNECLICKGRLEYLSEDVPMTCAICQKTERSKTRCEGGHYVCDDCHTQGMDAILSYARAGASCDGGIGIADGVQKCRGQTGFGKGSA